MPDESELIALRAKEIICGGSECPTCGHPSEVLIGPCNGCCESFHSTGKFLRRKATND